MIGLGSRVKDELTGATGVVTGRTEFLMASSRCQVQSHGTRDGKPYDPWWADEAQLTETTGERVPCGFVAEDRR